VRISATIVVERDGHKAMVIGQGGERLKRMGTEARTELETLLDAKVFIELWVKVRSGWAEVLKHGLICDAAFFDWIEQNAVALAAFEPEPTRRLIFRSAELHLNHIATGGDPFEMGSARPLDFGHWAAHKLEQLSEYRLRHGEAVAIGIALDVTYARLRGLLAPVAAARVLSLLERLGFELFASELLHTDEHGQLLVVAGLEEFREHLGGELTITLLSDIGQGVEVHEMDSHVVIRAIDILRSEFGRKVLPLRASA
jgi:3-dehydroquinate synthase